MAPKHRRHAPLPPSSGGSGNSGGGNSGGGSSGGSAGSGGSGSGGGSASSTSDWYKQNTIRQQNRQIATANAADAASLANIRSQAHLIEQQIRAIRIQLGPKGFEQALHQHLQNALQEYRRSDRTLMTGFRTKAGALAGAARDNEQALGDQSFANTANRIRERAAATSNTALQGAGESDTLRAQQMSLRNWDANQAEVSRSYLDTLRSVNSSLADLNTDTKTARVNMAQSLNQQRGSLWDQYYSNRADAWNQLSNLYGQQAQLFAQASGIQKNPESASYNKNDPFGDLRDRSERRSAAALRRSSRNTGLAYDDPGISPQLRRWHGRDQFASLAPAAAVRANSRGTRAVGPEGATLRSWDVTV